MQDIIDIHEDLERIKSALLQIFSTPLTEEACELLISCFLDELILNSDKTLEVACTVGELKTFLEKKAIPCLMKAIQDENRTPDTIIGPLTRCIPLAQCAEAHCAGCRTPAELERLKRLEGEAFGAGSPKSLQI